MKIVAIIQARMGSTRLPGKVLKILSGKTVLWHVIHRVRACALTDEVLVATTSAAADDAVMAEAEAAGIRGFRGSEEDVLARYEQTARFAAADVIVRVTSDCPVFDPSLLEEMLKEFKRLRESDAPVDYLSNTLKRTFPRGLDAEIFTMQALSEAHDKADKPFEREHVTPFFYRHPERFRLRNFEGEVDHSDLRWTLDTSEDFRLIQEFYSALYRPDRIFSQNDIMDLLERKPELTKINIHVEQKNT